jgi:type I restriction enzyme S subunit
LGRIPAEWDVVELVEVVPRVQYGISSSLDSEEGTPILRMNNLQDGKLSLTDLKYSTDPAAKKLLLRKGDVLFNRTNSWEHVGKTSIWNGELPTASFASYLVRLIPKADKLESAYLNIWLNLPEVQNAARCYATPAVQQVNINPTNLRKIYIKLPGKTEQRKLIDALAQVDESIGREEDYKLKLLGLRRALMQDILMGKVRVNHLIKK